MKDDVGMTPLRISTLLPFAGVSNMLRVKTAAVEQARQAKLHS